MQIKTTATSHLSEWLLWNRQEITSVDKNVEKRKHLCTVGIFPKKPKPLIWKDKYTPITALFLISMIWKQPKCPWVAEWMKMVWRIHVRAHTCTGTLFTNKREQNLAICSNMDRPRGYYAIKWNKSEKDRCYMFHLYIQSKKQNKWTSITKQI